MIKYLKLFHYLGLLLFLGSIFVYILISSLTSHSSLEGLVFARQIIYTGTLFLTIPGLGLVLLSGLVMTGKYYGFGKHRWLNIKQFLTLIILLNTIFFLLPIIKEGLQWAKLSQEVGFLLPEYQASYQQETILGGINVMLSITSIVVAIWKPKPRKNPSMKNFIAVK